jgi:hypothetical protein
MFVQYAFDWDSFVTCDWESYMVSCAGLGTFCTWVCAIYLNCICINHRCIELQDLNVNFVNVF